MGREYTLDGVVMAMEEDGFMYGALDFGHAMVSILQGVTAGITTIKKIPTLMRRDHMALDRKVHPDLHFMQVNEPLEHRRSL